MKERPGFAHRATISVLSDDVLTAGGGLNIATPGYDFPINIAVRWRCT